MNTYAMLLVHAHNIGYTVNRLLIENEIVNYEPVDMLLNENISSGCYCFETSSLTSGDSTLLKLKRYQALFNPYQRIVIE